MYLDRILYTIEDLNKEGFAKEELLTPVKILIALRKEILDLRSQIDNMQKHIKTLKAEKSNLTGKLLEADNYRHFTLKG